MGGGGLSLHVAFLILSIAVAVAHAISLLSVMLVVGMVCRAVIMSVSIVLELCH